MKNVKMLKISVKFLHICKIFCNFVAEFGILYKTQYHEHQFSNSLSCRVWAISVRD